MKKILFITAVVASIFIINSLVRSIYDLWGKQDLITKAQKELDSEKRENKELKSKLSQAQSSKFVEEEARNKLLLVKPGEEQVIISQDLLSSSSAKKKPDSRPNFRKWWDLFF
ncbi:MAG: hypothetical protein A3H50_01370 [Candidatus Levybacteria bacterium RIFCSPLOWO2_02_FULL_37_10]|nr:MAG: hypothetical protein A2860_03085 [Candidatus Levybacteria bacterium RIFCSPHIGHO2_01_FULL_37_33]OGH16931.1 MAG: hypothetical protein A3C97_00235 [Candidatus Levybacteria bacterium RIFCSPHIGHO2_02_FULL_37_11]OGH29853.1 MAG: hypothetical protein A3F30_01530 [Candidatus Levybacteria bacterium RIFCSPHIGHO2_12_FULL_37_12]OGH32959.1 MAG: hypothetical protein A2953_00890 [Candidatus Levybacteria bacterium RIFCSPLOWO2_01_FULL_36_54]OGH43322.1 MAG: hypothetical protein A3H50_01370 [Candidatus Lev